MKMHRRNLFKLTLLALSLALLPIGAYAKKGGGGKPGGGGGDGGVPLPNPVIVYQAANGNNSEIVVRNEDGTNRTVIATTNTGRLYLPDFNPVENGVVFTESDSEGGMNELKYTKFSVTGTELIVDSEEVILNSNPDQQFYRYPDISPDGSWLIFKNGLVSGGTYLKSLDANSPNDPGRYIFGIEPGDDVPGFLTGRAVWLNTVNRVALQYEYHTGADYSYGILVLDIDPTLDALNPTAPIPYSIVADLELPEDGNPYAFDTLLDIEPLRDRDGVIFSMDVDTGETRKVRGQEVSVVETVVFEWDIENDVLAPVGPNPAFGRFPCFNPDGTKVITYDNGNQVITDLVDGSTVQLASEGAHADWKVATGN